MVCISQPGQWLGDQVSQIHVYVTYTVFAILFISSQWHFAFVLFYPLVIFPCNAGCNLCDLYFT